MRAIYGNKQVSYVMYCIKFSETFNRSNENSIALRGATTAAYVYIYEYYRLYELPWDSVWTWVICALGMDLGYYWAHRATHGKNYT
jgi:sterol desaturase/sphingolipid hydroxylase (fatty acid hydroxylase superfamily)